MFFSKVKSFFKKLFKIFVSLCVIVVLLFILQKFHVIPQLDFLFGRKSITETEIKNELRTVSELTSAELTHQGLVKFSEGKIPVIQKKSFSMTYSATIKAGIDIDDIDIHVDETKHIVTLKVPKPKILSVEVDPDSIEFYDKKRAVLNWTEQEDTADALKVATKNAKKSAKKSGILEKASDHTNEILTDLFSNFEYDGTPYEVVIK